MVALFSHLHHNHKLQLWKCCQESLVLLLGNLPPIRRVVQREDLGMITNPSVVIPLTGGEVVGSIRVEMLLIIIVLGEDVIRIVGIRTGIILSRVMVAETTTCSSREVLIGAIHEARMRLHSLLLNLCLSAHILITWFSPQVRCFVINYIITCISALFYCFLTNI